MVVVGRVADGAEATVLASRATVVAPAPPSGDVAELPPARPADAVTVDGTSVVLADEQGDEPNELSLSISPATQAVVAPGRAAPDHSFFLSTEDLVPTSAVEVVQAIVFVASLVVFSMVIATARRRRLR